jgi:hypothetical protein
MPYDAFGYYIINEADTYEFELPVDNRIDLTSLMDMLTTKL